MYQGFSEETDFSLQLYFARARRLGRVKKQAKVKAAGL
jgi:hypothetical protein